MSATVHGGGFQPTRQQELLLRAAFAQGRDAIDAWDACKPNLDLDRLEPGAYRLLPQLFHNLHAQGANEPPMEKLKSVYRHSWYKNQTSLGKLAELLRSFQACCIEAMTLGETALVLLFGREYVLRPLNRIDILVWPTQASPAIDLLARLGWRPVINAPARLSSIAHCLEFTNATGQSLLLHWRIRPACRRVDGDHDLWDAAVATRFGNVSTLALAPTDQLLLLGARAAEGSPVPAFSWLADALVIVRSSPAAIEWHRLVAQSLERRLICPSRDMLSYLHRAWQISIPSVVLHIATSVPVSSFERIEYAAKTSSQKALGRLVTLPFHYLRVTQGASIGKRLAMLPRFLQYRCMIDA